MSVILSTFPVSGREQESVGRAGAEGLRAFSELNYAHEAPFFFFFPECTSQISDSV